MWKSGSTRRVLLRPLTSRRWLLWSGASLLAALLAALLGFLSSAPALAGIAKLMAFLFMMGFAVLFAVDRSSHKRTR